MAGVEGKDRGIHKEDKTGGSWSKRTRLAILFLCGLLLLVVAVPVPKTGEMDKNTRNDGESGKGETYETDSMADYEKYLEQKTAQTLGVVDGAGKVTVMITLKSTGQKVGNLKKISKAHIRRRRKQTARERQEKVKRNLWIKRPCTVRGQTERRSHM